MIIYKLWDKVLYEWQVCSYVGEYREDWHLINWYVGWTDWKASLAKERVEKNNYTLVWNKYYCVSTNQLSPVPTKLETHK